MMTDTFGQVLCALLLVNLVGNAVSQGVCTGVTSCYCTFDNGQFLDISKLGKPTGEPRFVNVTDRAETVYTWNPCFNFTEGDACREVAICAVRPTIPFDIVFALGYQKTANFTVDSTNSVQITYTTAGDGISPVRRAHILLLCESGDVQNTTFRAIGQTIPNSIDYYFELRSPLSCPQGTPNKPSTTPTPDKHLSTLGALLICAGVVIVGLLVGLILAVLKIKGKICVKVKYDNL